MFIFFLFSYCALCRCGVGVWCRGVGNGVCGGVLAVAVAVVVAVAVFVVLVGDGGVGLCVWWQHVAEWQYVVGWWYIVKR